MIGTSLESNVLCLSLAFPAKTGSAARAPSTTVETSPPPTTGLQLPGQPDLNGTDAHLLG